MENLWIKSHNFILNSQVGDFYETGENKILVVKRTPRKIYFNDGNIITVRKSKSDNFFYLGGKKTNQILRDIEGYFLYKIHSYK